MNEASEVLEYWFGTDTGSDDAQVAQQQSARWWGKERGTDDTIRARFSKQRQAAVAGELDHWLVSAQGRLALILLVDQFSRNLFRNDAAAFAEDARALHWCVAGIALGADHALRPIQRVFFYLPLEHSESLADQQRSVALYEGLVAEVPESQRQPFASYADFARRHRDIIVRFGRFPHRNAVLNRSSTPEELAFLQQPGSSF